jgi:transcription elongation GreA/GreB family factor
MLQLEMEKAGQQLAAIKQMKETLVKLDVLKTSKNACLGSIIVTDKVRYFLSISAGQLVLADKIYFAISISSPIGALLLGKQENEEVVFNGKTILINGII